MTAKAFLFASVIAAMIAPLSIGAAGEAVRKHEYILYVGTYTQNSSKGIYAYRFQPSSGKIDPIGLVAEAVNPSFLVVSPNHRFLYAANEVSNYEGENGYVSAFSIDAKTGRLALINRMSSGGSDPCHLTIDKTGKWLMAANYSSGSVIVLPIKEDGSLGKSSAQVQHSGSSVDPRRQQGPHAHSVNLSPDNRFLLVSDLGLDKVLIYRFDAIKGALEANDPPFGRLKPGSGPRHLSFHPNGRFVYQINELNSTITTFVYDPDRGSLQEIATISTLPRGFSGISTTAEVEVHPSGKWVYGSNRGHDSIAVFAVKGRKGILEPVEYAPTQGKTPRNFALDPTGDFLFAANQNSDGIALFRINRKTGKLSFTGTVLKTPAPVCIVFAP